MPNYNVTMDEMQMAPQYKIFNEDCITHLKQIPTDSIDCIVTSPPYNLTALRGKIKQSSKYHLNKSVDISYDNYDDNMDEDVYKQWQTDLLNECYRVINPTGSIFYNHKVRRWGGVLYHPWDIVRESNAKLYQQIIWDRGNSSNVRKEYLLPTTETIFWFRKDKPNVYKHQAKHKTEVWKIAASKANGHPASFPLELAENCILLTTQEGDVVLDPFAGSGTTLLAAKHLNRNSIGIEMSPVYCNLIETRLQQTIPYTNNPSTNTGL